MKITETNNNYKLNKLKKKSVDGSSEDFSAFMSASSTEQTNAPSEAPPIIAANPIFAVNSLTAINSLESEEFTKKENLNWGKDILEELDDLKAKMLSGAITEKSLHNISERLNSIPVESADKELKDLIEEIKTRAAVELAKLERFKN